MAATLAMTDVNASLRVLYEDNSNDAMAKVHKLYQWMDEETNFAEYYWRLPVMTNNPRGTANTLAAAQANTVAATTAAFNLTKVELFDTPKIEMALIEGAAVSPDSFFKKITNIIDGSKKTQLDVIGRGGYRAPAGVFTRATGVAAAVVTAAYPQDLYSIEIGDIVTASANADMSSPRAGTGTVSVVDKIGGTFTYTGTITSVGTTDYFAVASVVATPTAVNTATGLLGWSPASTAVTDTLFGQARTGIPYVTGRYLNLTLESADGVWARINSLMEMMPFKPTVFFANPEDIANFEISSSGKRQITGNRYDFGFESLTAYGMDIVADGDCPRGYVFGAHPSFKRYSLGAVPKICDADGNTLLRLATADACEARIISRYQQGTDMPFALITAAVPV